MTSFWGGRSAWVFVSLLAVRPSSALLCSAVARRGHAFANTLQVMYEKGLGVARDAEKAQKWLRMCHGA